MNYFTLHITWYITLHCTLRDALIYTAHYLIHYSAVQTTWCTFLHCTPLDSLLYTENYLMQCSSLRTTWCTTLHCTLIDTLLNTPHYLMQTPYSTLDALLSSADYLLHYSTVQTSSALTRTDRTCGRCTRHVPCNPPLHREIYSSQCSVLYTVHCQLYSSHLNCTVQRNSLL